MMQRTPFAVLLGAVLHSAAFAQTPTNAATATPSPTSTALPTWFPTPSHANCLNYIPTGAGAFTENSRVGCAANYLCVQSNDGDTSYVFSSGAPLIDTYTITVPSRSETITAAALGVVSRVAADFGIVEPILRLGGINYTNGEATAGTVYHEQVVSWTVNPATGLPWAWADFSAAEIGLRQQIGTAPTTVRTTLVYLQLCWGTPPVTPTITSTPTPTVTPTFTPTPTLTPRSCCEPRSLPGCDEPDCQTSVCTGEPGDFTPDPFCCSTQWDLTCSFEADARSTDICACSNGEGIPRVLGPTDCCDCAEEFGLCAAGEGFVCIPICTLVHLATCADPVPTPNATRGLACHTYTPTPAGTPEYGCATNTPTSAATPTPTPTPAIIEPGKCCDCPFAPVCSVAVGVVCPPVVCELMPDASCGRGYVCTSNTPTPTPTCRPSNDEYGVPITTLCAQSCPIPPCEGSHVPGRTGFKTTSCSTVGGDTALVQTYCLDHAGGQWAGTPVPVQTPLSCPDARSIDADFDECWQDIIGGTLSQVMGWITRDAPPDVRLMVPGQR